MEDLSGTWCRISLEIPNDRLPGELGKCLVFLSANDEHVGRLLLQVSFEVEWVYLLLVVDELGGELIPVLI